MDVVVVVVVVVVDQSLFPRKDIVLYNNIWN